MIITKKIVWQKYNKNNRVLDLYNLGITAIEKGAFDDLPKLSNLILSRNPELDIIKAIPNLPDEIERLTIDHNQVSQINDFFNEQKRQQKGLIKELVEQSKMLKDVTNNLK